MSNLLIKTAKLAYNLAVGDDLPGKLENAIKYNLSTISTDVVTHA